MGFVGPGPEHEVGEQDNKEAVMSRSLHVCLLRGLPAIALGLLVTGTATAAPEDELCESLQTPTPLIASNGFQYDSFGTSTAVRGDIVVIGAPRTEKFVTPKLFDVGTVYVYGLEGTDWVQQGDVLTASDGTREDEFGFSVSISGNYLAVGSLTREGSKEGAAYVFARNGTRWVQQGPKLNPPEIVRGDFFSAVSISGNKLIVGAWGDDGTGSAFALPSPSGANV